MFRGYKFGNISKGIYNKVTAENETVESTQSTKDEKKETKQNKGYQFGDITKSVYNNFTNSNYKFGDLTNSTFYSITSQFVPFQIPMTKAPIKEGFLRKRSEILLTHRKYWAVLISEQNTNTKAIYLCKNKQKYDECVEIIDLKSYENVQALSPDTSIKWSFDITSNKGMRKKRQRFAAESMEQRAEWIKALFGMIGMQKLDEMKESESMDIQTNNMDGINMECIAYYIIDLEYNHSEEGNPHNLLRNLNFILSSIIWSYMHDNHDYKKLFDDFDLDEEQKSALEYFQQPIAYAGGVVKGTAEGAISGAVIGAVLGGAVVGGAHPDSTKTRQVAAVALMPLGAIAGVAAGTVYGAAVSTGAAQKLHHELSTWNPLGIK